MTKTIWVVSDPDEETIKKLERNLNKKRQALFLAKTKDDLLRQMSIGVSNILVMFDEPNINSLAESYLYSVYSVRERRIN